VIHPAISRYVAAARRGRSSGLTCRRWQSRQNTLTSFATQRAVVLSILTLESSRGSSISGQHGRLPRVDHDDPSARRAIGFMFYCVLQRVPDVRRVASAWRSHQLPAPASRAAATDSAQDGHRHHDRVSVRLLDRYPIAPGFRALDDPRHSDSESDQR
jgi:hypothetical protein